MKIFTRLIGWLIFANPLCSICSSAVINLNAAEKPNVVFILSDNQSFYEMSCHGHADIKTPNIDRLADLNVELTNSHAPPFCSPVRSILQKNEKVFPKSRKPNGYRRAIFCKWHLCFSYPCVPKEESWVRRSLCTWRHRC